MSVVKETTLASGVRWCRCEKAMRLADGKPRTIGTAAALFGLVVRLFGVVQARKFRELFQNETAYEDGDSHEWVGATVTLSIAEISASLFEIDLAQRGKMGYVTRP